jgi:hypothetical protein
MRLTTGMITARDYLALRGRNPLEGWFEGHDLPASCIITPFPAERDPGDSPEAVLPSSEDRRSSAISEAGANSGPATRAAPTVSNSK